jgi:hypothetical protein
MSGLLFKERAENIRKKNPPVVSAEKLQLVQSRKSESFRKIFTNRGQALLQRANSNPKS